MVRGIFVWKKSVFLSFKNFFFKSHNEQGGVTAIDKEDVNRDQASLNLRLTYQE